MEAPGPSIGVLHDSRWAWRRWLAKMVEDGSVTKAMLFDAPAVDVSEGATVARPLFPDLPAKRMPSKEPAGEPERHGITLNARSAPSTSR